MKPRTRQVLFVSALALLAAGGYVRAASAGYRARMDALVTEAFAKRTELKLSKAQLALDYPTPEVTFTAPAFACPGQTLVLKGKGQLPGGTAFVYQSDDVEVLKETVTATSYEAQLKVKPNAPPQGVMLKAMAPVSMATVARPAVEIGCKHVWTLVLAGGKTLTLNTEQLKRGDETLHAEGEWSAGGKVLGKAGYAIDRDRNSFNISKEQSRAARQAEDQARTALTKSKVWKDLEVRGAEVSERQRACRKAEPSLRAACLKGMVDELSKLVSAKNELTAKAKAEAAASVGMSAAGCEFYSVKVSDGAITGSGERCQPGDGPKLTGTLRSL